MTTIEQWLSRWKRQLAGLGVFAVVGLVSAVVGFGENVTIVRSWFNPPKSASFTFDGVSPDHLRLRPTYRDERVIPGTTHVRQFWIRATIRKEDDGVLHGCYARLRPKDNVLSDGFWSEDPNGPAASMFDPNKRCDPLGRDKLDLSEYEPNQEYTFGFMLNDPEILDTMSQTFVFEIKCGGILSNNAVEMKANFTPSGTCLPARTGN